MRRPAAVLTGLAVVASLGGSAFAGTAASASRHLVVTGYAEVGSATAADVARDASRLAVVGVDGVSLQGDDSISPVSKGAESLRRAAHRHGRSAQLLVSNYSDRIGDFSEPLAHRMLTNSVRRDHAAALLVRRTRSARFDGIQLDLESLRPRDAQGLVAFAHDVRRDLPRRITLSMAVMAATTARGYRRWGYDLPGLRSAIDSFVLMAYDLHGPGWSGPGPIGPVPWTRRVLAAFARQVPARKIDLGSAGYGYRWGGVGPHQLSVAQARRAAGGKARWDATAGEWTASLPGGATLWWSDSRSIRLRETLATRQHLHGAAIWELGSVDRLPAHQ